MLTITVQDAALRQYLASLDARLSDLTPALADIGYLLETNARKRFDTRQDPNGRNWKEWADATRESYSAPAPKTHKAWALASCWSATAPCWAA